MESLNNFKYILLLAIIVIVCTTSKAQTQYEINQKASEEYGKEDKELNKTYEQILGMYKEDKIFINKFKIAQRAWVKYRDAYLESIFPEEDKQLAYGSFHPTCRCNELKVMTQQRIKELRRWIEGIAEGDPCSGSIRIKEQ